ncbi:methyl-accepting chemotaxis sensory transducer [Ectopseudomonas oleovorans]|uniref:Methyl-accepting chemotaxis sensory transducer n=1 Tax=Ectopseudomonas oleovorans (strain CECT 5344) TaxID=1182590 RepID=W6QT29_ECTO5|nr:methyl-accepting chemotaxis sensory transducer [Pseudomonas oleovorans CECT 5344]CDR89764.1 methyl-accepting chemotaxis sensory transducer [Pseudomonas oleovorans]
MFAIVSMLRSRLLRPVFVALGLAMLVQVGLAVWLMRASVDGMVEDLAQRLGGESRRLGEELNMAEREMSQASLRWPAVPGLALVRGFPGS